MARTIDMDRNLTVDILQKAYDHVGTAFIEIYQNCNVFNDKAFIELTGKETRLDNRINLEHGRPITFGAEGEHAVVMVNGSAKVVPTASVAAGDIMVHDAHTPNPSAAFALSRLSHGPYGPTPVGIFRDVMRSSYEQDVAQQLVDAQEKKGPGDLSKLIRSLGTWKVE